MSAQNILIWPSTRDAEALRLARRDGAVETVRGPVDTLLADDQSLSAVILPGQLVRAVMTDMPDRLKGAERLAVARFAHEDRLSGDPTGLHVVVGAGAPAPTRLVDPSVIEAVTDVCDPAAIYADFDALDAESGPTRLLDRVVMPGPEGYAVDPDWAEPGYAVPGDAALGEALFAQIDRAALINLRSGEMRRRRSVATGPWLRVAAVALVCGLLGLGVIGAEARAISAQAEALDAEARSLYQARTGQVAPARLSSLARQAGTDPANSAQFLDLSQRLFNAISLTPDTQVERLSYEPGEGRLRLRLIYPNFDAAAALEEAVAQSGGQLITGGVREQNGVFIGDAALALQANPDPNTEVGATP